MIAFKVFFTFYFYLLPFAAPWKTMMKHENKKRGTVCPHLQAEGRRNHPKQKRLSKSSSTHKAWSRYVYLLSFQMILDTPKNQINFAIENFLRFQLARKSITLLKICRDEPKSPSEFNHQGILCYRLFEFMAKIAEILCNAKFFVIFLY